MEYTEEQEKANQRFEQHRIIDPYPFEIRKGQATGIMPALLNWNDIQLYVDKIGMISPFKKQNLKPASYALELLGQCIYYDDKGEKQELVINRGEVLELASNSIVFLTLEPLIQLPDYIAARFNLKIDLIYKGCLLGTGPLVDPGFIGRLSFPLHNLTTNDYYLEGGSEVAWIEFTKLSPNEVFKGKGKYPGDDIKDVPYRQFDFNDPKDVWGYMCEAHSEVKHKGSIRSSIPDAMAEAKTSALNAERSAKDASDKVEGYIKKSRYFSYASAIAVLLLAVSIAKFFYTVYDSINKSEEIQAEMLEEARVQVSDIRQEVNGIGEKLDSLVKVNSDSTKNNAISPSETRGSTRQSPPLE